MMLRLSSCALLIVFALTPALAAQPNPDWTTNHQPFRIAGNLYYVGSKDLAAYLITTPAGAILINSNLRSSVPQIRKNIETLGFHLSDVKILLISHAHFDHAAGSAQLLHLTHAQYDVMDGDASVVETGGRTDFFYGRRSYEPAHVDRILHDGDQVTLGGTVLIAHLTAGHTKGCTTWTLQITEAGRTYNVVIIGSTSVLEGYKLMGDPKYPQMAADFARSYRTLHALPCDIFLGSHAQFFDMDAKFHRLSQPGPNPFIDPVGCQRFITEHEQAYQTELARQSAHHP